MLTFLDCSHQYFSRGPWPSNSRRSLPTAPLAIRHGMLLPFLAVLAGGTALASLRGIAPAARITPVNAIQSVQLAKAGHVLND